MRPVALAPVLALALVACGGGGGGGGGGGSGNGASAGAPELHPPSFFETTEYQADFGLQAIEASSAYATGASGQGILVGVIDTGIDVDHPEFAGQISPASIDITGVEGVQDVDGHGTAVAGVVAARKNDALSHGVAFDAELLIVRAAEPGTCAAGCLFDPVDVAAASDYATLRGARVINYSLGGPAVLDPTLGDAMARAVDAGAILVLSAGNEGDPEPSFPARFADAAAADGRVIAVGAVDADNEIASFSNRAGAAEEHYLVAPGVEVLAPALGGGAALVSGTSFAAPHVTGAVALVLEAAPFLRPEDVVELLLETATDLGAPGVDPIYGRGLINVGAALAPQGALGIPTGGSVEGPRAPVENTTLSLGPAFGPGPRLGRAILLDGYGRPYGIDLDSRTGASERGPDLLRWLVPGERVSSVTGALGDGVGLRMTFADPAPEGARGGDERAEDPWGRRFALDAALGPDADLALVHGWSLQNRFGLRALQAEGAGELLGQTTSGSPYLALADGGDGVALGQELGRGLTVRFGLARGDRNGPRQADAGTNTVLLGALSQRWAWGGRLGLQLGRLTEQQNLLDASGGGALRLARGARTTFVGLAARLPLGAGLELYGQGSLGFTEPQGVGGLFEGASQMRSSGLGVGVAGHGVLASADRLDLVVSQPLRVDRGSASLERPVGRTMDGHVVRQQEDVDLAPEGRELDLEVGYHLMLSSRSEIGINWLTRLQPGHDPDAAPAHALALKLRHRF